MNLEQMFESSYDRVIGQGVGITEKGQKFFTRFYENFFAASKQVSGRFGKTDMAKQVSMLQKGVYHLISFYLVKTDNEHLSAIATSHSKHQHNIEPALYDIWLESLLQTVEEMDPEYQEELKLAWQIVMMPGILYMKHHYEAVERSDEQTSPPLN